MARASARLSSLSSFSFTFSSFLCVTLACGPTTHIEVGHRALKYFKSESDSSINYEQLMRNHQDAFQGGNPYPDAYYPDICFQGKYHDIAEDTHWAPFLNVTVNYIREHYPLPWDEETEKLVVFLFGLTSHQVADVSWHSLGISQGFLTTMGNINFHGSFPLAHSAGDFGGDVLNQYELRLPYMGEIREWYIPTDDLEKIYLMFYGENRLPIEVIRDCTLLLYLERLGEKLAIAEVFAETAKKSPYIVDKLEDYFLGGLDDMAAQTGNVWQDVIIMMENGTRVCDIPHNPIYINCNRKRSNYRGRNKRVANGFYMKPNLRGLDYSNINVTLTKRGMKIKPSSIYLKLLEMKKRKQKMRISQRRISEKMKTVDMIDVDNTYGFRDEYSKFGWSLATGDVNNDGIEDVVVGTPGYGSEGSIQQGKVYVLTGNTDGSLRKSKSYGDVLSIYGPVKGQSKFSSSLAVLDVNLDGYNDLAIGAPSTSQDGTFLDYKGMVYVYFGTASGKLVGPNMTIGCQSRYCNCGWTMTAGDINADGHADLLIGSPYAPSGGEQRGLVAALYSSKKYQGFINLAAEKLDWTMPGDQNYSWFGYSLEVKNSWIVIGQPVFRICAETNCSYSAGDKQSVGKFHLLKAGPQGPSLIRSVIGSRQFDQFGTSMSIGRPYDKTTDILAVSAVSADVSGKILDIGTTFTQAGQVYLYNMSELVGVNKSQPPHPVAVFSANRRYSRFGAALKLADLTGSGYDDMVITSPLYSDDVSELVPFEAEEGRVLVFNGGAQFPRGDATYNCQGDIEPCPLEKASQVFTFNKKEERARFGWQIAVQESVNNSALVMSAIHSSYESVHMQGAVTVYYFNKTNHDLG